MIDVTDSYSNPSAFEKSTRFSLEVKPEVESSQRKTVGEVTTTGLLKKFIDRMIESRPEGIREVLNLNNPGTLKMVASRLLRSRYADEILASQARMNHLLGL